MFLTVTAIARPLYYQHSIPAIASTAQTPADIKRAALTFDDGPHPVYTAHLLDELKKRGVKATFFVTGEHAELHPDLIKRTTPTATYSSPPPTKTNSRKS